MTSPHNLNPKLKSPSTAGPRYSGNQSTLLEGFQQLSCQMIRQMDYKQREHVIFREEPKLNGQKTWAIEAEFMGDTEAKFN